MIKILDFDSLPPEEFLNRDIQAEEDVSAAVDEIIREVRARGDAALRDYTRRFDGAEPGDLWVSAAEFDAAREAVDPYFLETLREAGRTSGASMSGRSTTAFSWRTAPAWSWASGGRPLKRWASACPGARRRSLPPF